MKQSQKSLAKRAYLVVELLFAIAFALLAVAAAVKILAVVSADVHAVINNAALAAWVQAVGSISAILGAFAISANQSWRDKIQRWNDSLAGQIQRVEGLRSILIPTATSLLLIRDWIVAKKDAPYPRNAVEILQRAADELAQIRIEDLPDGALSIRVLGLQINIKRLLEVVPSVEVMRRNFIELNAETTALPEGVAASAMEVLEHAGRLIQDLSRRIR